MSTLARALQPFSLTLAREPHEALTLADGLPKLDLVITDHFMPSMFARHRESSAPAVSRVIRQLVRKKLITVSLSDKDGRQRRYQLTARGQKILEMLRATRRRAIDAIWMDLDPRALAAFTEFSGGLIARLEAYARQGKSPSRETPTEVR